MLFNVVLFGLLRRARSRGRLAAITRKNADLLLFQPGWRLPLRRDCGVVGMRDMLALQGSHGGEKLSAFACRRLSH